MGIIAAAIVWHYYLGPKYAIKRGDKATLEALHEADLKALHEAIAEGVGEIIARSDITYPGEGGETGAAVKIEQEMPSDETQIYVEGDPKSRFTMIVAPVKYHLIKDAPAYAKFTAGRGETYPKVDFKKDMIIFVESDSRLASGFFEIEKAEQGSEDIIVSYKLNIIGSAERSETMPHTVQPKSDKKIILQQVK